MKTDHHLKNNRHRPDVVLSGAARSWGGRRTLLFGSTLLLSSGLIVLAALGDLWLDEIWSLHFARESDSVADLFFRFQHDNNHLLNTLYLYFLEGPSAYFTYRLPAVASGIGTLFLMGHTAHHDWGYPEALLAVLLAGTSFPLLLYFSEARGYAPAIFFAILAYTVLVQNLGSPNTGRLLVFWAASLLGILSHATFAIVSVALLALQSLHTLRAKPPFPRKVSQLLMHQTPPLIFLGFWYLFFIRHMVIGQGPVYSKLNVVTRAAALALGWADRQPYTFLALAVVFVVIISGTWLLKTDKRPQWAFFPAVLLFSPFLLLLCVQPTYLYFRYFIVCFPFFYLLLAYTICRFYQIRSTLLRLVMILLPIFFIIGQTQRLHPLLILGRGNYARAVDFLANHTAGPTIVVSSDSDFAHSLLFDFYAPMVAKKKSLRYVPQSQWQEGIPDWFIFHSQKNDEQPLLRIVIESVGTYRLAAQFRSAEVSGWRWFLYRRTPPVIN